MSSLKAFRIRENFNANPPFYHKRQKMEVWQELSLLNYFEAKKTTSICLKFPKKKDEKHFCLNIQNRSNEKNLSFDIESSYFVGANWVIEDEFPIFVEPKFNIDHREIELDYIAILFEALKNTTEQDYLDQLVYIDYDKAQISIDQKSDLLTPLLVIQYLHSLNKIVKKGLRKTYYRVKNNLVAKVKGKVLVAETLKKNYSRGNMLKSFCTYDEFGVNYPENKLLKKALTVGLQHLSLLIRGQDNLGCLEDVIASVRAGFQLVDDSIDMDYANKIQPNPFYKDYKEALNLADKILKRFGYNVSRIDSTEVTTPPFWIDMSKLFELFLLEKLNSVFKNDGEVIYQEKVNGLYPDFLIKSNCGNFKIVVDAKYKGYSKKKVDIEDIRQVSGYSRMNKVYEILYLTNDGKLTDSVIDCLIIYPDLEFGVKEFSVETFTKSIRHPDYFKISTLGIHVPYIQKSSV